MKKNRITALCMIGMLLLISGCSRKIPAENGSEDSFPSSEEIETVQASTETGELQVYETAGGLEPPETEETYDSRYFTGEKTEEAVVIILKDDQEDKSETEVEADVKAAVYEYVSCLYPGETICDMKVFETVMDGQNYMMFQVEGNSGKICEVAFDSMEKIYYLFDAEMNILIPIEYDEYGVRLLG